MGAGAGGEAGPRSGAEESSALALGTVLTAQGPRPHSESHSRPCLGKQPATGSQNPLVIADLAIAAGELCSSSDPVAGIQNVPLGTGEGGEPPVRAES